MTKFEKLTARFKKATGDLMDDAELRRQGTREERKAEAKEEAALAEEQVEDKQREVARLERDTR